MSVLASQNYTVVFTICIADSACCCTPSQSSCLQEYSVDDLCELLLFVGQANPKLLEGLQLDEILVFMVVFMGSPGYVQNPFLRSRISEVCTTGCSCQLHALESRLIVRPTTMLSCQLHGLELRLTIRPSTWLFCEL